MSTIFKISDLRSKDIVNMADGRKLGPVRDIEVDLEMGKVIAVVMPANSRFFGIFTRNEEMIIPWQKIKKIGVDVVLIEADGGLFSDDERNVEIDGEWDGI